MTRLAALGLFLASSAMAGERLSLSDKVFGAELIVEVKLPAPGRGRARPATVERVVFPPGAEAPELPATVHVFSSSSPCQRLRQGRAVKALLFFKHATPGKLLQWVGVEGEWGRYSDLHPAYPKLVEAAERAALFHEERMRAVGPQLLWQQEKAALGERDNPYLMSLAAEFLRRHGAAEVIDERWGQPGTPERQKNESLAQEPGPENVCRPR